MSSTRRQKSKLLKLMESKEKKNYETTIEDCHKWFHILNQELFSNKLPQIDEIDIRWRRQRWAEYICYTYAKNPEKNKSVLHMNKKYNSKKLFVEVLAHELVHHYQFSNDMTLGHGESFDAWKEKFNRKGLSLQIGYSNG